MTGKIGAVCLGLMCLVAVSSFVCSAEAPAAEKAPTIGEMAAGTGTAESAAPVDVAATIAEAEAKLNEGKPSVAKSVLEGLAGATLTEEQSARVAELGKQADAAIQQKAEAAVPEQPPAAGAPPMTEAERVLQDYARRMQIEQESKKVQAAEYVQEARHLLYTELKPDKAYELAQKALILDPKNTEAANIKTDAGLELGIEAAKVQTQVKEEMAMPTVRRQAAFQALLNTMATAQQLYGEKKYEESLKKLRLAESYVASLSVYMDVSQQQQELARLMPLVEQKYKESQKALAAQQKKEAQTGAEAEVRRITDQKRKEQARRFEAVQKLIEDMNFDQAGQAIDNMEMADPTDDLIPVLRQKLSDASHQDALEKINAARVRGDLKHDEWESERERIPEKIFGYPDKDFWVNVVEKRVPPSYPSDRAVEEKSEADKAVLAKMTQKVSLSFVATPLTGVADYLQQMTNVSFLVRRQDLPVDQAPVTLTVDTTLENALKLVCDQTGMAWKVKNGVVMIGLPESMREYEMRVYPVRDILVSIEDQIGTRAGGGGSSTTGRAGAGGGTTGTRGGGGGGIGLQFAVAPDDVAAQYGGTGVGGAGGVGGGGGGAGGGFGSVQRGNAAGTASLAVSRAQDLVLLIKNACGQNTWTDTTSGGLISTGGTGIGGVGGRAGGVGGIGGIGGAGGRATGFGGRAGPTGGLGFPGAPGGVGIGGPGAGGFGGALTAAQAAMFPQGAAYVVGSDPGELVVLQTDEVHKCIEKLLKELRAALKIQVQVDVRFLEVGSDFLREVGFDWTNFKLHPEKPETISTGGMPSWTGFNAFSSGFDKTGLPFLFGTSDTSGLTLNLGWNDSIILTGMFRLAEQRDDLKTLSAPRIVLANGQLGYLTVATSSDYVSTFDVSQGVLTPQVDTVSDSVDLTVRPIVSWDRKYVFLELLPTVTTTDITNTVPFETFVGQPGGGGVGGGGAAGAVVTNSITLPVITSKTLATTVGVPDRGMLIVGGLSTNTREHKESGLPILSKIPIIRRLFTSEGNNLRRATLFIVAKPTIIILAEEEETMR
jgi:hypothetical protein